MASGRHRLKYHPRVTDGQSRKAERPENSRNPVIIAALITAAGAVIAAILAAALTSHGSSGNSSPGNRGNIVSPVASGPATAPVASSPTPFPHGTSTSSEPLFSVPQTPGNRQESGTITYSGERYPESFQLDTPAESSATFAYALSGQWSKINLVVGIPTGGNGAANIGVTISVDGQAVGSGYIILGSPYSAQFSVTGVKMLTISFDTSADLSPTPVLVAGNLYH
jgi:hypothetical protein